MFVLRMSFTDVVNCSERVLFDEGHTDTLRYHSLTTLSSSLPKLYIWYWYISHRFLILFAVNTRKILIVHYPMQVRDYSFVWAVICPVSNITRLIIHVASDTLNKQEHVYPACDRNHLHVFSVALSFSATAYLEGRSVGTIRPTCQKNSIMTLHTERTSSELLIKGMSS